MCGIAGIINSDTARPVERDRLARMRDVLVHRGPDDSGLYVQGNAGLVSTRLAIIDLSPLGHMPMTSEDGRYHIVYNGELYNYREMRDYLVTKGYKFFSKTDTEVVLKLFMHEGPKFLSRSIGMFAFAIWDSREKTLFACRDRAGIKPFHYAVHDGAFCFASEPKALFAAGITPEFDEPTWNELLCFRHVAGERTVYRGVHRLLPGYYLQLKDGRIRLERWWSLKDAAERRNVDSGNHNYEKKFRELFEDSVALRRISDVPVGTLLSGGLDSGVLTGVMAKQVGKHVASFTVRFTEPKYDEGDAARAVTDMWSLDHHELFVPPSRIPSLLEEATRFADAPIMHENALHILAISRYAKAKVTVLLSGEGADETMGGYVRHRLFLYSRLFPILRLLPGHIPVFFDPSGRLNKSARLMGSGGHDARVLFSSSEMIPPGISSDHEETFAYRSEIVREAKNIYQDPVRQVMYYDQNTYLQSVMERNDAMTMGASIECREPYLDYRIVEWLAGLPTNLFFERGVGKALLRRAMAEYVPQSVLKGRKWGFGVPMLQYFRNIPVLRSYIESLPSAALMESSLFRKEEVKPVIKNFLLGDNSQNTFVRQLVMTSVWFDTSIIRKNIFPSDEKNPPLSGGIRSLSNLIAA